MRTALRARRAVLPVIDLAQAGGRRRAVLLERLRSAAAGPGAFHVTGTGIPSGFGGLVPARAREFFAAPLADRMRVAGVLSPHFRGYSPAAGGFGERFDIGPEHVARPVGPDDPPWHRLTGPNLWPATQPSLEPLLLAWNEALLGLSERLLRLLTVSLQRPGDAFEEALATELHTQLALVWHPGGEDAGLHKDYGFLTLLLQDDRSGDGGVRVGIDGRGRAAAHGVDVPGLGAPGTTFLVVVGRLLETATDGYLRAAPYGLTPSATGRITVPFTLGPALDAPVPALTLPSRLAAGVRSAADDPADPLLAGYGAYALKGRLHTHPQVAERHHPELLTTG